MMVSGRSLETGTALLTGAFGAAVVVSSLDPHRTFLRLIEPRTLPGGTPGTPDNKMPRPPCARPR